VAGFISSRVIVSGGTLGGLFQETLTHYFATFTPDANIDATTATIQVAASAVLGSGAPVWFDLAGNPGTASNTVSISEDKTPTAISIAASGPGITNGNGDLNAGKVVTLTLT
jgi:hypothetical protein